MNKDYGTCSNEELLKELIGVQQTRRLYKGTLQPLFSDSAPAKFAGSARAG